MNEPEDVISLIAGYAERWAKNSAEGDKLAIVVPNSRIINSVVDHMKFNFRVRQPDKAIITDKGSLIRILPAGYSESLRGIRLTGYIYFQYGFTDPSIIAQLEHATICSAITKTIDDKYGYWIIVKMQDGENENDTR